MGFPQDFFWGTATASYQIEGAANQDGRGASVWDMFCKKGGNIWNQQSGEVACDHYHRYKEDVALMKNLGVNTYRFSVSWSRVLPSGIGSVNEKGLDFYDRLVDELLKVGINPFVTLFHWDYPYELYCKGGWLNSDCADWFAEYVLVMVNKLGDRVKHWITLNEPQCFIVYGHKENKAAPGDMLGIEEIIRIKHNVMVSHGKAVQAIRKLLGEEASIGYAPVGTVGIPASESEQDIQTARDFMFKSSKKDLWCNSWWMDPVYKGVYPEDYLNLYEKMLPKTWAEDLETINQPLDFFGINIYNGRVPFKGETIDNPVVPEKIPLNTPLTNFGWPVTPKALYWGPRFFYERYKLPIIVTENGMANVDWVTVDGKVSDPQRVDFIKRYLSEFSRAYKDGVDIKGYFLWSMLDNFEWGDGYKQRFGITYVDYVTQKRILKDSALFYKDVIATNGRTLNI
ncbi:GH1 family beta-glucosidase [bacterium]|nr:GH1 family beta-glucosidase [bacterium]